MKAAVNSNINVTPMVDVMLVLLIIFMVVTPMLQKGVSVDMAKTNNPVPMADADKEDALLIAVNRDGTVFFGTDKIAADQLTNKLKESWLTAPTSGYSSRPMPGPGTAPSWMSWTMSALRASTNSAS